MHAVPRIAARHTTTHNHSVTDDVLVVGTTEVPEWGTPRNAKRVETTALWDWAPHEAVIRNAKRFETTVLWDRAPHEAGKRNAKRDKTYILQDWAPSEAPSSVLGRAEEKSSMAPRQGVWVATTTIALVRRWSGGLRCCMLTP